MYNLREQILFLYATPMYVIVIGLEIILANFRFRKKVYNKKDTLYNLLFMLLNAGIDAAFKIGYVWILQQIYDQSPHKHWETGLWYWLLLLVSEDFVFYWLHRFDHHIRLFWAVHVTHHSSQHFNFSVGFRSSIFEPLYRFIYFIPLTYIGFKPLDIVFIFAATQIWGTLVHTELVGKLGWLEYIFVTPSHHRVHHASNAKYLDKNMGMFLIIWDKMFGTFQKELPAHQYAPIKYGLTKNLENPKPTEAIFHEWEQMIHDVSNKKLGLKEKLLYVVGPPGYSHDGSRKTSQQLLQEEENDCPKYFEEPATLTNQLR